MSGVSEPFIRRPVATWLLALGVVLVGLLGYRLLPVSALPQVDFPTIQVVTRLPGASADTMASLVTTPLERQFGQIAGLAAMTSVSSENTSAITLQFELGKSLDVAAEDVQAAIDAANGVLPSDLPYPPAYSKVNPADPPILTLTLTSDTLPITRLNDIADTVLAQKLSQISGVGRVQVEGGQRPAWRIQLDPARLAGYGLTLEDARTALAKANVNLPKGTFEGPVQSMTVGANDQVDQTRQFANLVLAAAAGTSAVVRVRDVGRVVEGVENARVAGWSGDRPAVILDVLRQPGANIVATADLVKARLPDLERALPAGVALSVLADRTATIRASVADVQVTLLLTMGLVVLVIFLFLRNARATLIPGIALPLSLIATFGAMSLAGFSLDNLSLMALTIASGFVVDDAIVMVENIVRHLERGDPPLEAALKGAGEIGFTIVSLTVSLVAVFIPLLFMTGIVGRLFREFALTLTVAVVMSAVVSLTLTPTLCGQWLRSGGQGQDIRSGRLFLALAAGYERSLAWVLRHQGATLAVALASLIATVVLYMAVPKGFLPSQDTGLIIATTDAPADVSFAAMTALQRKVAEVVRHDPDVAGVASFLGAGTVNPTANTGHLTIVLTPRRQRSLSADGVIARLDRALAHVSGIVVHMKSAQDIQISPRASRTQFQYTLTDIDAGELARWAPRLVARLAALPQVTDVASDAVAGGLEAAIAIDRDRASRLGVSPQTVDNILYDAFGQRQVSTVYSQVNQYHVILEVEPRFQIGPEALSAIYVAADGASSASTSTTLSGGSTATASLSATASSSSSSSSSSSPSSSSKGAAGLVPLGAFATVSERSVPLAVVHQNQFPAVTLSFNLAPGASLGEAIAAIAAAERAIGLPDTVSGDFTGDAAEFRSSLAGEPWLILAAAAVIYIVLGVLYESTIHPLTIMSTLPSAGVGALVALILSGRDLSLVGLIGIILLMGIVKKNGIMMVDFALVAERDQGLTPERAIFQASLLRFRPIMMTTMAALLGALPLAFDSGTGSELRRPLGIAIVGGLLVSQSITLYTTPVVYLALGRLRRRLLGISGAAPRAVERGG